MNLAPRVLLGSSSELPLGFALRKKISARSVSHTFGLFVLNRSLDGPPCARTSAGFRVALGIRGLNTCKLPKMALIRERVDFSKIKTIDSDSESDRGSEEIV